MDVDPAGETLAGVHELQIRSRDYGVQNISVDESMVTLSAHNQKRVDMENATILAVLAQRSPDRLWSTPFKMPVPGDITGPFGVRRVYNGKPKGYHNGVDISAPRGTPVTAPAGGRVVLVGDYFMTGRTVVLDHGLGLHTAYFHMDSAAVVEGEVLEAGAVVGLVGSTGRSTGAHLHWGVYVSGVRGDPESMLDASAGIAAR
jgi:murein DD-endopeptidase MepM/ murein hydrolase activator NlpD